MARIVAVINAMDVDGPTPSPGMKASSSVRRKRIPGRSTAVIPGGSRRHLKALGTTNNHELPMEIVTYYSATDDVLETAIDDQADMADVLETATGDGILNVLVDLGGPGETNEPGQVVYRRSITVIFRKD